MGMIWQPLLDNSMRFVHTAIIKTNGGTNWDPGSKELHPASEPILPKNIILLQLPLQMFVLLFVPLGFVNPNSGIHTGFQSCQAMKHMLPLVIAWNIYIYIILREF